MKQYISLIIFFLFCFLLPFGVQGQCKVKPIVKDLMPALVPYDYDSYAVKEITYGTKAKKDILEFSVYSGEEYKLIFGKTVLPQEIGITIYDGNPQKKGKIIFIDESGMKDKYACNFRPTKTGTYYIQFEVPPATTPNQKGCFVVLIGILD